MLTAVAVIAFVAAPACRSGGSPNSPREPLVAPISTPTSTTAPPVDPATLAPVSDTPTHVRVATWNLKRFGHGDKHLDLVSQLFEQLDVVAVQEVMSREAVDELLAYLPGWRAAVSSRAVGRTRYVEYYAVFYRSATAELIESYIMDDVDDRFARDPFVACFVARSVDFCLVTIHVIYGDRTGPRDAEIAALGEVTGAARTAAQEKDWIVLGDFNRAGNTPGWGALLDAGWTFTLGEGRTPTTIGKSAYRNPYDHILIDPRHTATAGAAQRVDVVNALCDGDFERCARDVSDHAPVSLSIDTTGPDDD